MTGAQGEQRADGANDEAGASDQNAEVEREQGGARFDDGRRRGARAQAPRAPKTARVAAVAGRRADQAESRRAAATRQAVHAAPVGAVLELAAQAAVVRAAT